MTPDQIGIWILVLIAVTSFVASLVAIVVGVKRVFEPKSVDQQPLSRAEAVAFASRAEVVELKSMIEKQWSFMESRFRELTGQLGPLPTQIATISKQVEKVDARQERIAMAFERRANKEEPEAKS